VLTESSILSVLLSCPTPVFRQNALLLMTFEFSIVETRQHASHRNRLLAGLAGLGILILPFVLA
jgi:hypothetical protein